MVNSETNNVTAPERAGRLDPVAQRLAAAGEQQSASVLEWLECQHQRKRMRRRAVLCAAGGWGLLTAAAVVSSAVAISMSRDIHELISGIDVETTGLPTYLYLPGVLVGLATLLIVGGIVGWLAQRLPGFSNTVSAIDWSAASDAVTRLLSIGCTYPEAFRTAASVARGRGSHLWLMRAAERVERGGPEVTPSRSSRGDAAVLELLIEAAGHDPQRQWKIAADHFLDLSHRRLVLFLQSTPMIVTILSGLLIWIAISSTLGWMWRAVAEMIRGYGF